MRTTHTQYARIVMELFRALSQTSTQPFMHYLRLTVPTLLANKRTSMATADGVNAADESSFSTARYTALDTAKPNIARVYDYWLGGKDNFAADREEAERMLTVFPRLAVLARENRQFLARAVTWLAEQGIRQFLDV